MQPTVYIMMFGWPVLGLMLFATREPRKAVLTCILAGWLLLPQAGFKLSGLPDYSRTMAVILGVVLGIIAFDRSRLSQVKLKSLDLPIIVWCICHLASSLSNGLGFYDGCSGVLTAIIEYGIPYFVGRMYFADGKGMRELAIGIVLAMLCYVPLIIYELRMSPQLHKHVYGFLQIPFHMIWRFGWYRPMVFLHHGLELGVLIASAALTAMWLWRTRAVTRFGRLPAGFAALTLLVVCLLCRALNGYVVLITELGILYLTRILKTRVIVILIVLLPSVYVYARIMTNWDATPLVGLTESIEQDRAKSFQSRISHEITLIDKALRRPYFGWGGWNRNRADELAEGAMGKRSITDSLWIIVFGQNGIVGLFSLWLVLLLPIMLLVKRLPPAGWFDPENAPAAALSMVLLGFTIDCLANAMVSPIYFMIAGGLISYKPVIATIH